MIFHTYAQSSVTVPKQRQSFGPVAAMAFPLRKFPHRLLRENLPPAHRALILELLFEGHTSRSYDHHRSQHLSSAFLLVQSVKWRHTVTHNNAPCYVGLVLRCAARHSLTLLLPPSASSCFFVAAHPPFRIGTASAAPRRPLPDVTATHELRCFCLLVQQRQSAPCQPFSPPIWEAASPRPSYWGPPVKGSPPYQLCGILLHFCHGIFLLHEPRSGQLSSLRQMRPRIVSRAPTAPPVAGLPRLFLPGISPSDRELFSDGMPLGHPPAPSTSCWCSKPSTNITECHKHPLPPAGVGWCLRPDSLFSGHVIGSRSSPAPWCVTTTESREARS